MASATYHVVVTFGRNEEGNLVPGEGAELPNGPLAQRRARTIATDHAGVVAFSRSGDPTTGVFEDAVVLYQRGEVDLNALAS